MRECYSNEMVRARGWRTLMEIDKPAGRIGLQPAASVGGPAKRAAQEAAHRERPSEGPKRPETALEVVIKD